MNLIRTVLELRYDKPATQFNFLGNVIQSLGGSPIDAKKIVFQGGVRIKLGDKKSLVVIETQRIAIGIEESVQIDDLITLVCNLCRKVNEQLNWGKISRIGLRTDWIQQVNDFEALVASSKTKLFQNNGLIGESTDIALPLTFFDQGNRVNYVYGPMKKEQATAQYLDFKNDEETARIPQSFGMVDIDYIYLPNRPYSRHLVKEFLDKSMVFSKDRAEQTFNLLEI